MSPLVSIVTTSLPNVIVDVPYNNTVSVTGNVGTLTWSINSGALPSGLSIGASNGVISGTTSAITTYSYNVRVTDTGSATAFQTYDGTVEAKNAVTILTVSLPSGVTTIPYDEIVSVVGIYGTALFTITSGALPTGLTLNTSTGEITGSPSAVGTFNFTIKVDDTFGTYIAGTASQAYSVQVIALPVPGVNPLPELNLGFGLINAQFDRPIDQQYSIDDPEGRKTASAGLTGQSTVPRTEFRLSNLKGHGRVKKTFTSNASDIDVYVQTLLDPDQRYAIGKSYVTMAINSGVIVGSTAATRAAMTVPKIAAGSPGFTIGDIVEISNSGRITGRGGDGGPGNRSEGGGAAGVPGSPGVRALYPIELVNNSGAIIAGGGGGGAGGSGDRTPIIGSYAGGGGGGGAGIPGGPGGSGYRSGTPGGPDLGGSGGAGEGGVFGGARTGGPGGNLGQPGTNKARPGGAAGNAIVGASNVTLLNSGTLVGPTSP